MWCIWGVYRGISVFLFIYKIYYDNNDIIYKYSNINGFGVIVCVIEDKNYYAVV